MTKKNYFSSLYTKKRREILYYIQQRNQCPLCHLKRLGLSKAFVKNTRQSGLDYYVNNALKYDPSSHTLNRRIHFYCELP